MFSIATGFAFTLNETFTMLKELKSYRGCARYELERPGDVKNLRADISLATKGLSYQPLVGFEAGLQRTVEWYRTATHTVS